ncbi:MAG: alpha-glucosidase [Candidatus Heimdallarchaeota archaeon]|nr:alpha-glucosidase [Candidatus Heimdallarchaeota archaeon]
MTIILRMFNLLTKIPGFFTFYLWLKFVIYGKKPPKNPVKAYQIQKNIVKNILEIEFTNNRVEIEGDSSDLRFNINTTSWPTVLSDDFIRVTPKARDEFIIDFGTLSIDTQDDKILIKDIMEINYLYSENWTRLLINHNMDHLYGLGEKNGGLNKQGGKWEFWNIDNSSFEVNHDPLYKSYPILILSNKETWIALILDYPGYQMWDLKESASLQIDLETREFILHVSVSDNPKSLSKSITRLLGQMDLPPLWALGYHQSRWSYHPKSEVLRIAKTLREKNIPCDAIYLDIDYMDDFKCFTWDEVNFGNLPELITELHEMDFKVVPMIDPGIKVDESYGVYTEGKDKGYFCQFEGEEYQDTVWPGMCAFPDFFREDVREWWKENYQELLDIGVDGFFNDMNEVSTFNLRGTMPNMVKHKINNEEVDHYKVHNLYSQMMAKASYDGLNSLLAPKRTFLLIRSSYLGSQKYGFIWTGDNKSDWDHMAQSIPKLINSGLSGHFANGADVGGFRENPDSELFVRWLQLSVFYPLCRNHTAISTNGQEPWVFGEEIEEISRKFISLRYKLLPYFYTWFRYAARIGVPLLRPLWMEYPNDEHCYDESWTDTQFFFGPDIMVAPILTANSEMREIYLPVGIWYDFFSLQKYEGSQIITYDASLNAMPIFVKEGAIIPIYEHVGINVENTSLNEISYLTFGEPNEGYLYRDDGATNKYLKGDFNLFRITKNLELELIEG